MGNKTPELVHITKSSSKEGGNITETCVCVGGGVLKNMYISELVTSYLFILSLLIKFVKYDCNGQQKFQITVNLDKSGFKIQICN